MLFKDKSLYNRRKDLEGITLTVTTVEVTKNIFFQNISEIDNNKKIYVYFRTIQ